MRRFGNVPVPDARKPSDLKRLWRETRAALDSGMSLIVFAEGKRTLDGRMGEFEDGVSEWRCSSAIPSCQSAQRDHLNLNRKDRWWLHPSNIVVHIHDTIETAGLKKMEFQP